MVRGRRYGWTRAWTGARTGAWKADGTGIGATARRCVPLLRVPLLLVALLLAAALPGALPAGAQPASAQPAGAQPKPDAKPEVIGTWRLVCADATFDGGCVLRHKDASLQAGGYGVALEVRSVNNALVPVVAVRGVGPQKAIGTLLTVTVGLRLDTADWIELPCGPSLLCLPPADALPGLAMAFPVASQMRLRLQVTLPNGDTLPVPEHLFDLRSTKPALVRLRASGVTNTAAPAAPGLDWKSLVRKLMKSNGG